MRRRLVRRFGKDVAACCGGTIAIEAAIEEALHAGVDDHVGGAGVEGEHVFSAARGGEHGEVGDAAEVEQQAALLCVAKDAEVEHGDERRGLSAGGHVGGAEVADDGNAEAFGDDGGFAGLPGAADGSAEIVRMQCPGDRWSGRGRR